MESLAGGYYIGWITRSHEICMEQREWNKECGFAKLIVPPGLFEQLGARDTVIPNSLFKPSFSFFKALFSYWRDLALEFEFDFQVIISCQNFTQDFTPSVELNNTCLHSTRICAANSPMLHLEILWVISGIVVIAAKVIYHRQRNIRHVVELVLQENFVLSLESPFCV